MRSSETAACWVGMRVGQRTRRLREWDGWSEVNDEGEEDLWVMWLVCFLGGWLGTRCWWGEWGWDFGRGLRVLFRWWWRSGKVGMVFVKHRTGGVA